MNKYIKLASTGNADLDGHLLNISDVAFVSQDETFTETTMYSNTFASTGNLDTSITIIHGADYSAASIASSGTADTDTANQLVDSGATFEDDGVVAGDYVLNTTDGTRCRVGTVAQTALTLVNEVTGAAIDLFPNGNENYVVLSVSEANGIGTLVKQINDVIIKSAGTHWRNNTWELDPLIDLTNIVKA